MSGGSVAAELDGGGGPPGAAALAEAQALRGSRWTFRALLLFLASQAFTVPVLVVGPSWSLWPTLTDLSFLALVAAGLVERPARRAMTPEARRWARRLGLVVCVAGLSLVLHPLLFETPGLRGSERWRHVPFGAYQLVRLVQCWAVFLLAARVPLDVRRLRALRGVVGAAFVWTVVLVALTYLGVVRPLDFAGHLPRNPRVSGPWTYYRNATHEGLGTVGYNHGYVGLQAMALGGLLLVLGAGRSALAGALTLVGAAAACFLSGSRAAFVAWALLCVVLSVRRPALLAVALVTLAVGAYFAPSTLAQQLEPVSERQATVTSAYARDGMSGRDGIWRTHLRALQEDPLRWVVGWGFGSTTASGDNAHQQLLQLLSEGGLFALAAFLALLLPALRALWRRSAASRMAFWVSGALLVTALTQETFYPVPAFGHFLSLYACLLGLALGPAGGALHADAAPPAAAPHAPVLGSAGVRRDPAGVRPLPVPQ